jgi:hypothetical protein
MQKDMVAVDCLASGLKKDQRRKETSYGSKRKTGQTSESVRVHLCSGIQGEKKEGAFGPVIINSPRTVKPRKDILTTSAAEQRNSAC